MVNLCRNNTNGSGDYLNVSQLYLQVCDILKEITIDYDIEARELCSKFFDVSKNFLQFCQETPTQTNCDVLETAINSRVNGMPLQYILGEWDFYGEKFLVGEGVLIPRADTETLIDAVLSCKYLTDFSANENNILKVLDICSGTGCIAITLERTIKKNITKLLKDCVDVTAIEKSELAFGYLNKNLDLHKSNVYAIMEDALIIDTTKLGEFDIIVSNPPYITPTDIALLQKEVQFEPKMALDGGDDGLYFYRELTKKYVNVLKSGGELFYEIGIGQENDVEKILIENNLKNICFYRDMCGIIRVVSAMK